VLALLAALLVLGGGSPDGRVHFGEIWLTAGDRLAFVGEHVKLATH
jgi:hypothetical protein